MKVKVQWIEHSVNTWETTLDITSMDDIELLHKNQPDVFFENAFIVDSDSDEAYNNELNIINVESLQEGNN